MIAFNKAPLPVRAAEEIDLDSHVVIEASAGTGKTHAIEELVVALLRREKVRSLDEILVMTFTEKAAGELKDRIREGIKKSLATEASDILKISLDNFDSASIFTIHGFCNKIIQEYAFENREQFQNELIDDRPIYRKVMRQIMRQNWPGQYGDFLHDILKISNYPDLTGDGKSRWEERVIDIALKYQPGANDVIIPGPVPDLLKTIREAESTCAFCLDALSSLVGPIDRDDPSRSGLCAAYASLTIRKNSMLKRTRILTALLKLLVAHADKKPALADCADFFTKGEIGDQGFSELNTGWKGGVPDYKDKLPQLEEIISILETMRSIDFYGLRNLLASAAICDIKALSSDYKKSRGLISYEDMISRVYSALADASGDVTRILRRRYRYALVDEFQDTDMQQWNIFRAVFLGADGNRLFIISDPKQAIYGFRGADINAYFIARDEMIRSHGAGYYCLVDNWRSSPGLIRAFNGIFGGGNWFTESAIDYLPSNYPRQKDPPANSDTDCLFVVDCGSCAGTEAKFKNAEYIAAEIRRITESGMRVATADIAVLVKKWAEAEAVEKSLKKAGVRYSYYKKEGLYQSRESLELYYLLCAIARPNDRPARKRALATRFFGVPADNLRECDDLPIEHPASVQFSRWHAYAAQKDWPGLFQSIIEDSRILFRLDIDDYDRSMINYRNIVQDVSVESFKKNYTINNILAYLKDLRAQESYSHESHNLEKIDAENPGVQIMTVHASKGLQFRVVFLAGGYTRRDMSDFWSYHRDRQRIFDLAQAEVNSALHDREISGEEERLFYVAFTRARDRLYVPVFQPTPASKGTSGILGKELPSALKAIKHESGVRWIDLGLAAFQPLVKKGLPASRMEAHELPDPLFPDPEVNFLDRTLFVESFSGLKSKLYAQAPPDKQAVDFGDTDFRSGEDEVSFGIALHDASENNQANKELPRGIETGLMMHDILEQIDYKFVGGAAHPDELLAPNAASEKIIAEAIQKRMSQSSKGDDHFLMLGAARIVWNTMHAALDGTGLCLHRVDKKMHEMEFYYPSACMEPAAIPGVRYSDGFIHGFIDLVFSFTNRFYIVDWKSNYIDEGYSAGELAENIRSMHYDLQIALYASALIRWMKQILPGYSYEDHFGGVYYLYLRGMDIKNPGSGIYFYRPAEEDDILNVPSIQQRK